MNVILYYDIVCVLKQIEKSGCKRNTMFFAGICLSTKEVKRLSDFYQKILQTTSDCDDEIHQEIHTQGAFWLFFATWVFTDTTVMSHVCHRPIALILLVFGFSQEGIHCKFIWRQTFIEYFIWQCEIISVNAITSNSEFWKTKKPNFLHTIHP